MTFKNLMHIIFTISLTGLFLLNIGLDGKTAIIGSFALGNFIFALKD